LIPTQRDFVLPHMLLSHTSSPDHHRSQIVSTIYYGSKISSTPRTRPIPTVMTPRERL
jgi:hypothetical protein